MLCIASFGTHGAAVLIDQYNQFNMSIRIVLEGCGCDVMSEVHYLLFSQWMSIKGRAVDRKNKFKQTICMLIIMFMLTLCTRRYGRAGQGGVERAGQGSYVKEEGQRSDHFSR